MTLENDTEIGSIIGSNSHIDYVGEIYTETMREDSPEPTDFEFGQFVYILKELQGQQRAFIGIIYDTQLVDPDQGRSGPRLAQPDEQNIFQPSYVDEKQVLTGILILGYAEAEDGELVNPEHSIPRRTLEIDDVVRKLSKEDIIRFHEVEEEVRLEYYQRIVDVAGGFAEDILSQVLTELKAERPGEADALDVIQKNLEWQTKMGGVE
jgi:hypothetical protein